MTRKIELTAVLEEHMAKTRGVGVDYFTTELGIWTDKTEAERLELFSRWVDKNKYDTSYVWYKGRRIKLVFRKGYTVSNQIDEIMEDIAGDGNDDVVISFHEVLHRFASKWPHYDVYELHQRNDLLRTIFHNLNTKWLPTNEDQTYWTQYLAKDNEDPTYSNFTWPTLPSVQSRIFKAGFDPNAD